MVPEMGTFCDVRFHPIVNFGHLWVLPRLGHSTISRTMETGAQRGGPEGIAGEQGATRRLQHIDGKNLLGEKLAFVGIGTTRATRHARTRA